MSSSFRHGPRRLLNDKATVVVVADAPAPVVVKGAEEGRLVEMRAVRVGGGGGALQSEDEEEEGRRVSREAKLRTGLSDSSAIPDL